MSIIRRLSGTAAGAVAQLALGLAASIIAARYLGPQGRGELAALLLLPQTLQAFVLLGMSYAITYFTAQQPAQAGRWLGTATLAVLITSLAVAIPLHYLTPYLLNQHTPTIIHTAQSTGWLLCLIIAVSGLGLSTFLGLKHYTAYNLLRLLPTIAYLASILTLIIHPSATSTIWVYLLILTVIITPIQFIACWPFRPFTPSLPLLTRMAPYAGWSLAVMVPQILAQRLDQFAVLHQLPSAQLGYYSVALGMGQMLMALQTSAGAILLPYLADGDLAHTAKHALFARLLRLTIALSAVMVAGALLILPTLLPLMFGTSFTPAILPAMVLVVGAGITGLNVALSDGFRGLGWARLPLWAEVGGLFTKVLLLAYCWHSLTLMQAALIGLIAPTLMLVFNLALFHTRVTPLGHSWLMGFVQDAHSLVQTFAHHLRKR